MTIDFTKPVLFDQPNNGYMVTMKELPPATNGGPNYEVLEGYPNWPDVQAWLAGGNVAQPYVPPAAMPPTAVQQAQATIAAIQAKMINGQIVAASAVPPTGLTLSDVAAYKAAQAVLAGGSAT